MKKTYNYLIKLVVVGNSSSEKSIILQKFCENQSNE